MVYIDALGTSIWLVFWYLLGIVGYLLVQVDDGHI